jgi:hypothetical protein
VAYVVDRGPRSPKNVVCCKNEAMPPPDQTQRIDYRLKAGAHIRAAREMLASSEPFAAEYACLHARFALEALAYDRVQDYLLEVSADAMNGWTPKAVLRELLYTDPEACSPINVTIGWRPDPDGPLREIHLGEGYRFSARWGNKMHNALSNFLHEPTIKQAAEGDADRRQKSKDKVEEALLELGRVLASPLSSFRAHRLVKTQCRCGSPIARDLDFIEAGKIVACSACGRVYNCRYDEAQHRFEFWPQQASWTCIDCKTFNSMDAHELKSTSVVECSCCGEKFKIETKPILRRIVDEDDDSDK